MKFKESSEIFVQFRKFEELVIKILKMNKLSLVKQIKDKAKRYDLIIKRGPLTIFTEIKLQRTKMAKLSLVKITCQRLLEEIKDIPTKLGLLIISSYVNDKFKNEMQKFGIIIWDIRELFGLTSVDYDLTYGLESFLFKVFNESVDDFSKVKMDDAESVIRKLDNLKRDIIKTKKIIKVKGKKLCNELRKVSEGSEFAKYEKKCIDILEYLFHNDLELWRTQHNTKNKLHRFDLLCRLRPSKKNFWDELANDFKSRYIVFEFKNYSDQIEQNQIYTTEKYLFRTALRSIAIIIARNDASKNAYIAASGALKEAGKLIVILSSADLCKMLEIHDKGNEPTDILREKVDQLLTEMSR